MPYPAIKLELTTYHRDGSFETIPGNMADVLPIEHDAMKLALSSGRQAGLDGNPPVGAVLIDHDSGKSWGAKTIDKTSGVLLDHAEIRVYGMAAETVGDDLSNCSLVTTAQPCNTCTSPYAEGKIGRIVFAAPRAAIFAATEIMRPRKLNMHELLVDGDTHTQVIGGYMGRQALKNFIAWSEMRQATSTQPKKPRAKVR
jgi:tRNA(adenine34) deaminase